MLKLKMELCQIYNCLWDKDRRVYWNLLKNLLFTNLIYLIAWMKM